MTDTEESQTSDSDQDVIFVQQKDSSEVYECELNTKRGCPSSEEKAASPVKKSSDELGSGRKSTASPVLFVDSSASETDHSASSGSESHAESSALPLKQKLRSRPSKQQAESLARESDAESSDSSLSPEGPVESSKMSKKSNLNLKAIFAYHFRGKKFKAAAHRKYKSGSEKRRKKYESTQMPVGRPSLTASPQERKKRLLDRGFQFPFVEKHYGKKHIPLKMVLDYEQAAVKGFFQYIEMLKYEEHLKKALKNLKASEDLERECLTMRKHKYLDDEGPISPIQETNDSSLDSDTQEDFDARVVVSTSEMLCMA